MACAASSRFTTRTATAAPATWAPIKPTAQPEAGARLAVTARAGPSCRRRQARRTARAATTASDTSSAITITA
jgi:hypothetical protein